MAKVTKRAGKVGPSTRRTRLIGGRALSAESIGAKSAGAELVGAKTGRTGRGKGSRTATEGVSAAEAIAALTKRLAQARRHIARLEARADTDFLLDIPNRRGFERELNRSIAYVRRYRASAALLIVDVDRLKPINDGLGHAAGDHLLRTIVGILSSRIRQSDMLGRLGGDEFGIILWNLDPAAAVAKAAALERAIDGTACEYRGQRIMLGVSVGVTALGAEDEAAKVLDRADRAMYARKQARRSRRNSAVKR